MNRPEFDTLEFREVPADEMRAVDLFLRTGVRNIEASAYMQITPALVKFRLKGIAADGRGRVTVPNRVMAKISRPEVADVLMEAYAVAEPA